ncbi:hypothetical protein NX059_007305 [Plenodomus lindquistii]|nr:hypothetical protein NX059_007305 [Plenodomus lindquistii]
MALATQSLQLSLEQAPPPSQSAISTDGVSDNLITTKLKDAAKEASRPEPKVYSYTVDISNPPSVKKTYDNLSEAFNNRLDIVVNNAAHMEPGTPSSSPQTQTSTGAPTNALCTQINVSSSGALSARSGSGAYRSSKLAILRWTEGLALGYAEKGLLTYGVNPGAIKTKISEGVAPEKIRNRFPDKAEVPGDTVVWLAGQRGEWLGGGM